MPVSICGQKIETVAQVAPSTIELNKINLLSDAVPTCSFKVYSNDDTLVDSIFIPERGPVLSTNVKKVRTGLWTVKIRLDRSKLPIGLSRVNVPIRFRKADRQILGGTEIILDCNAVGEVAWSPNILNLSTIRPGSPMNIHLYVTQRNSAPIIVSSIQSTVPWIQMKKSSMNDLFTLSRTATPSLEPKENEIAGYFQVQLQSPVRRTLRIFYFGSMPKEPFAQAVLPAYKSE
jgi:hypothetical protein